MFIEKAHFSPMRAGDWIVQGEMYIKGEFTEEEWERIKTAFIALGLFQVGTGQKRPSELVPTRAACMDAIMEDAREGNHNATQALRAKFNMPEGMMLPNDIPKLLLMNGEKAKKLDDSKPRNAWD